MNLVAQVMGVLGSWKTNYVGGILRSNLGDKVKQLHYNCN
jgi:hypothetical protein